jgi:Family of unknown function (DUF6527)
MQVSPILRRGVDRYFHWCPACEHMHPLPDRWKFNGDVNKPTFSPSFNHSFGFDKNKKAVDRTCHYIITDGKIQFCPDSWHKRSDIVAMPLIPSDLADKTQD